MFLSDLFVEAFVDTTNVTVELYENDGSVGAAIGAGIGSGVYPSLQDAFLNFKPIRQIEPSRNAGLFDELYNQWKHELHKHL
jgi:xylulokinase